MKFPVIQMDKNFKSANVISCDQYLSKIEVTIPLPFWGILVVALPSLFVGSANY